MRRINWWRVGAGFAVFGAWGIFIAALLTIRS